MSETKFQKSFVNDKLDNIDQHVKYIRPEQEGITDEFLADLMVTQVDQDHLDFYFQESVQKIIDFQF